MYSNGFMKWDKVIITKPVGCAKIVYECTLMPEHPSMQYGFLETPWLHGIQRVVGDLLPNTISLKHGYNEREPVEKSLNAHYDYIKKYAKSGLTEVYMAYLYIAHVNDNLWQALKSLGERASFTDIGFTSGNTQKRTKQMPQRHKDGSTKVLREVYRECQWK